MPNLFELKKQRHEVLTAAEAILDRADRDKRELTAAEAALVDEHMARVKQLNPAIEKIESLTTIRQYDPVALLSGRLVKPGEPDTIGGVAIPENLQTSKHHSDFFAWARNAAGSLVTTMEASDPSGVITIGSGTGQYSSSFVTPLEILPFEKSYIQFAPFERAGARIIPTDHMRDVNFPVLSAGAPPDSYSEGQGPAAGAPGSKPFGLSGFTFKAYKRSRQVVADWESLMSTEVPMQPFILDELLCSIANVQTQDATQNLYNALTAPPGVTLMSGSSSVAPPLQIGGYGVEADVYGQLTALRHSLVDGLEGSTNCWMLSRNTLAIIRNTRANSSGVVMFDPESDTILGRPYVTNEYFDSICGAGFVAYGNWNKGAFLRRTPLLTRVLQELYALNNEIGFLVTQWADSHYLAELVGAANPPTHQPIYFTQLPSGALA